MCREDHVGIPVGGEFLEPFRQFLPPPHIEDFGAHAADQEIRLGQAAGADQVAGVGKRAAGVVNQQGGIVGVPEVLQ